jgi:hypothetical protein
MRGRLQGASQRGLEPGLRLLRGVLIGGCLLAHNARPRPFLGESMAKEPFRKGQSFCIFCNSSGVTHEHMWADWLKEYIPRTEDRHRTGATIIGIQEDEDREEILTRAGDLHSRRIKCVCGPCNNGWMSGLQTDAKPILVPTLIGEKIELHRRSQTILSAWITMMAMVSEYLQKGMSSVPSLERVYLETHQKSPKNWRIWIGRHNRQHHPRYSHRTLPFVTKEEFERTGGPSTDTPANTQTTTICLGKHLLIHVMSSDVAWSLIRRWRLPPQIGDNLLQIWPIKDKIVRWPPDTALTDAGISLVADDLMGKVTTFLRSHHGRPAP